MSEQWYCSIDGKETGPLSAQQLKAIASRGHLSPEDLVRPGTSGEWIRAKRIKGLFLEAGQPPHESSNALKMPQAASAPAPAPPPLPPSPCPTAPPPRLASSAAVSPPPMAGDFGFLEEAVTTPHAVATVPGATDALRPHKDGRRRQLALVLALLATLVVLAVAVVAVSIAMNEPPPASEQVAAKPPAEKPSAPRAAAPSGAAGKPATAGNKAAAPAADRKAKPAATSPVQDKWVNAKDSAVTVGEVQVKIRTANLGRLPKNWSIPAQVDKSAQYLLLTLELSNSSKTRKIDHLGWDPRTAARAGIELTDEMPKPNHYGLRGAALGLGSSEPIYPGQSIEDKLIFERPIEAAKMLRLRLPASVFGGVGMIQFEIPREMIVESTELAEPALETPPPAKAMAEPVQPRSDRAHKQAERTGDPVLDFGIGENDNQMRVPTGAKSTASTEGAKKADQDQQTKKSQSLQELKEKPVDKEGGKRRAGFRGAQQEQSPF